MAYTPTNWQTGDVVTAERLNKLENGVTSAQVYTESETVRFSGSVTTQAQVGFNAAEIECDLSDAPEQITVVFDGTEYTASKTKINGNFVYGGVGETGPEFSEYPFAIMAQPTLTNLFTETASTHQVVIKTTTNTINQELADVISNAVPTVPIMRLIHNETLSVDAVKAFNDGKLLYFTYRGSTYIVTGINGNFFTKIPDTDIGCSIEGEYVNIGK